MAKGHWTKGKRRNPDPGALVVRTRRLLRKKHKPGKVSLRALAAALAVDPRTLGRWLNGEDFPQPAKARAWGRWLNNQEAT